MRRSNAATSSREGCVQRNGRNAAERSQPPDPPLNLAARLFATEQARHQSGPINMEAVFPEMQRGHEGSFVWDHPRRMISKMTDKRNAWQLVDG